MSVFHTYACILIKNIFVHLFVNVKNILLIFVSALIYTYTKPESIILLILPIILSRISYIFHPLFFIPMLSPIILYYFSNLIELLVKLHMAAAK